MSAWARLAEAVGIDPDDELADFAGEIGRPVAWDGRAPLPRGHRPVEAMGRLPDGTRIKLWVDRGDGMYDATVYRKNARGDFDDAVLHRSEFEFERPPRHLPR